MVMYKNVNGEQVLMKAQEETDALAASAAATSFQEDVETYAAWETSLPSLRNILAAVSRAVGALAAAQAPVAQDLTDLQNYVTLIEAEPPKPEVV